MKQTTLLTTVDNPFSPFDQWDDWVNYDHNQGYFTCERLARICNTSDLLSDGENDDEIEYAMDEMIKVGVFNKDGTTVEYKKVTKD